MIRDEPYRLLKAAGAPELPPGYWYRVRMQRHSDHLVDVEVRCDRELSGSLAVGKSTFSIAETPGRTVLEAAAVACREAYADASARETNGGAPRGPRV
ncbi:hypothetical protein [Streptomyces sp. NPDC003952]